MRFNSPLQAELKSKFHTTERYGTIRVDKDKGYFTFGFQIGPGNPILPISSITGYDYEIEDGDRDSFVIDIDYEPCAWYTRRYSSNRAHKGILANVLHGIRRMSRGSGDSLNTHRN